MAFLNKDMSVIAYANGFTLWHYRSMDNIDVVCGEKYFPKKFADLTANGDIMIVNAGDSTCIKQVKLLPDGNMKLTNLNN